MIHIWTKGAHYADSHRADQQTVENRPDLRRRKTQKTSRKPRDHRKRRNLRIQFERRLRGLQDKGRQNRP